jgi:hypothetical protein
MGATRHTHTHTHAHLARPAAPRARPRAIGAPRSPLRHRVATVLSLAHRRTHLGMARHPRERGKRRRRTRSCARARRALRASTHAPTHARIARAHRRVRSARARVASGTLETAQASSRRPAAVRAATTGWWARGAVVSKGPQQRRIACGLPPTLPLRCPLQHADEYHVVFRARRCGNARGGRRFGVASRHDPTR